MYSKDTQDTQIDRQFHNPERATLRDHIESAYGIDGAFKRTFNSWLAEQYGLNLAALDDLGFGEGDDIPALEQVEEAAQPSTTAWLADRFVSGYRDRLVLAPSAQAVGIIGDKYAPGFVPRFDEKQGFLRKTRTSKHWASLGDKNPIHDNGNPVSFTAAILLDNTDHRPKLADQPTDNTGRLDHGTIYAHSSRLAEKIATFETEEAEQAKAGRYLASVTVPQLIVVTAQERQLGPATPSGIVGTTALVHYPTFRQDGREKDSIACQPTFYMQGNKKPRVFLGERWTAVASEPLRRVVRLQLGSATEN